MIKGLLLILALLALGLGLALTASPAEAQNAITVPLSTGRLTWTWAPGTPPNDGAVEEFRMKCGPSTGNYTRTTVIADPAARSIPVASVVTGIGNYFCVVTAANAAGESGPSNEVNFIAGNLPAGATDLKIESQ
jgi:hypothetical protein